VSHDRSPAAERLDALQYALGEGPCLDVAAESHNVLVADATTDARWPGWSSEARSTGLGSALALRLHTDTETMGTLTLYSRRPGAFDDEAVDIALIYAAHATEAMSKARLVAGLRTALESRHSIGIAQGVLAARYDVSYERAFEVLHRFSNDNNIKLRDVAEMVARDRGLPDLPDLPDNTAVPETGELDPA
jgi:GAF domain-containing protein